jgi:prepilin peptidase CpaA
MPVGLMTVMFVFPLIMTYAAVSDLFFMRIPNVISVILIVMFPVAAYCVTLPLGVFLLHLICGGLILSIGLLLFYFGWIGGGDAKLLASTSLWFGFDSLMPYFLVSSLLGGVLSIAILFARARPLPAPAANWDWARRLHSATSGVPYGIALAFAALIVLPETALWRAALINTR